jgi:hypothetical protein
MNYAHIHIILNHFPTIGSVIGLGLFLVALVRKSQDLQRASLIILVVMALLGIPTYLTGSAAQDIVQRQASAAERSLGDIYALIASLEPGEAEEIPPLAEVLAQLPPMEQVLEHLQGADVSPVAIERHQNAAMLAFLFLGITGALAWLALWQLRRFSRAPQWNLTAISLLGIVTVLLMVRTGTLGGDINHPEIRPVGTETAAAEDISWRAAGQTFIFDNSWAWPAGETIHFIGLTLLMGVAITVNLRVLGMIRSVPFPALHRLLPVGVAGFFLCLATGMMFFVGNAERYILVPTFAAKIALIMLAGINLLYFTLFDQPWAVGRDDDAPLASKAMAVSTLVFLVGALYFGRMIPFLE